VLAFLECKSESLSIEVCIIETRHSFILVELRRKSFNGNVNKKITTMSSESFTKYAFITVTSVTALYFILQRKKKLDVEHSSESFINSRNGSWYVYINTNIYMVCLYKY
jgi:alpha-acetolactate decarboxylase